MGRANKKRCHHRSLNKPVVAAINKGNQEKKGHKKRLKRKKSWKGVTCPVCLEIPHNSVVLLCSSYHKGCRPYMCATGNRFSNCLEQYQKAYAKDEKKSFIMCPLCRGQVKGWSVVEDARKYHNSKKRECMNDNCFFLGSYRQMKKHVKAVHPGVKPRAIDPVMEQKWKKLEVERDRIDAMVVGDYVNSNVYDHHYDHDPWEDELFGYDTSYVYRVDDGYRRRRRTQY